MWCEKAFFAGEEHFTESDGELFAKATSTTACSSKAPGPGSWKLFAEHSLGDAFLSTCQVSSELLQQRGRGCLYGKSPTIMLCKFKRLAKQYNRSARGAISQIKQRNYPSSVSLFTGDILLVGINYNRKTKTHTCKIEKWVKED